MLSLAGLIETLTTRTATIAKQLTLNLDKKVLNDGMNAQPHPLACSLVCFQLVSVLQAYVAAVFCNR